MVSIRVRYSAISETYDDAARAADDSGRAMAR